MGVHVLHDNDEGKAILYCSTTGLALGRVFRDSEERPRRLANEIADTFLFWYERCGAYRDPRHDPRLADVQDHFLTEVLPHVPAEMCGECGAEPYDVHRRWCEVKDWRDALPQLGVASPLGSQKPVPQ